jgi:hypothetical protein
MSDKNGFTGIKEVDSQIIMDLWFQNVDTYCRKFDKARKLAIVSMINLYNTCHYFRNILDDPIFFQQFQIKIGYKMFARFADIDSLNELIKCIPMTTKNGNDILTKLTAGNVVSEVSHGKNYRIINASDSHARMIEIDIKGMIVGKKIIKIFSEIVNTKYLSHWEPSTEQLWLTSTGTHVNNFICLKTRKGIPTRITSIESGFIRVNFA